MNISFICKNWAFTYTNFFINTYDNTNHEIHQHQPCFPGFHVKNLRGRINAYAPLEKVA